MSDATTRGADSSRNAAKALYEDLRKTGLKTSAERIWRACNLIEDVGEGSTRITVSAVARICIDEFGGPKAQSIRNQPKTLKKLVLLRADALTIGPRAEFRSFDESVAHDPGIAAYIRVLEERLRQAERSNNRLRSVLKNLDPDTYSIVESDEKGLVLMGTGDTESGFSGRGLSYSESESIRAFLRENHLDRFGLSFDDKDRIVEGRSVLMETAAVGALRRLLVGAPT